MTDIDEIFAKLPLKEIVGIDDAERQMKFCIVAHMAPSQIRLKAHGETTPTKEFCFKSFKKLYRVLDTMPFIDCREEIFDDAPKEMLNGFKDDPHYEGYGRYVLRFDATFVHLKDIMKFVYLMKHCIGDCSWIDIIRNGSCYANNQYWFRIGVTNYVETSFYCGLPAKTFNNDWVSEKSVREESIKMMNFFKTGIFKR